MGDLNTLLKSAINETKNLKEGESLSTIFAIGVV
jgi:hypothetical protein